MDDNASITIAVRVRPPTPWERERLPDPELNELTIRGDGQLATPRRVASATPLKEVVTVMDDKVLVFDKADESYEQKGYFPPGTKRSKNRRFIFDRVFETHSSQGDVFENTTRPLLDGLLDGFNATVFAYGATGCGKTHTISGTPEDPGIIYLTMAELFQRIDDKKEDMIVEVHVTFLEIYNEEIRDLLADGSSFAPKGGLAIREDKGVKVLGLTEMCPTHAKEVKEIVKAGNARRTQSPTLANETSSRSHAVLQIHVTQTPRTAATTEERTMATLSIIDLAGSERASATKNMGQRMVEGANINKSLLALGNCINALCEGGSRTRHIPYRNSKLTRLLKFSLGGNCRTVMIVCVAPTSQHFEDTLNTLQYADRAKMIRTKVSRNLINVDRHVGQYVEAINRLNEEVAELKGKLAGRLGQEAEVAKRKANEAKAEVERVKVDMQHKVDQVRGSIVSAAGCTGNLDSVQALCRALRLRIGQIDTQGPTSSLSSDLAAERGLLLAMATANDALLRPDSVLNQSVQKAGNANNMFNALLRAVSERRYDRLDEASVENIRLDARTKRAEMDRLKADAERDALKVAVGQQAALVTSLVGILARCTAMANDGSAMLRVALDGSSQGLDAQAGLVATSLSNLANSNDAAFTTLLGHSTTPFALNARSSLTSCTSHGVMNTSAAGGTHAVKLKVRRPSHVIGGSPLRIYKRNSMARRSIISQPGLLLSRAEYVPVPRKVGDREKKSLRWKDEAGEGSLDDAGLQHRTSASCNTSAGTSKILSPSPESEWEDERTEDDSVSINISMDPASLPLGQSFVLGEKPSTQRLRHSRIDPHYLKGKKTGTLGSLTEDDESGSLPPTRNMSPLTDRLNQLPTPPESRPCSGAKSTQSRFSHQPDDNTPPARHGEATLRSSTVGRNGRRRSNGGPVRSEKTWRRSSMIQQPLPPLSSSAKPSLGGARRVLVSDGDMSVRKSPAKRGKKLSLLGPSRGLAKSSLPFDTSVISVGGGSKIAWK